MKSKLAAGIWLAGSIALMLFSQVARGQERLHLVPQLGIDTVTSVAFSADGRFVLTGCKSNATLWDFVTGRQIRSFLGHSSAVNSVAFSPDDRFVLTASNDQTARLWDAATGQQIRAFEGQKGSFDSAVFSPDGRFVLTQDVDAARLWDATTGRPVRSFAPQNDTVWSVAISQDGRFVVTGGFKTVRLWDAATGQLIRLFPGHTDRVTSVVFSPDGRYILTGSDDLTARLWKAATGELVRTFTWHSQMRSVAFSPNGRYVLTLTDSPIWTPDGSGILEGSENRTARLWDIATGLQVPGFVAEGRFSSVAFFPDGRSILAGNGIVASLLDAATGQQLRTFEGHTESVHSVAFSPEGRFLLTGNYDKTARLWDAATGRQQFTLDTPREVTSVAFSPDGRLLLSGSLDKIARIWDAATGQQLRSLVGHRGAVFSVAFSPDGRFVLTGSDDRTARLWDATTGQELRSFQGGSLWGRPVAFSPDGRLVLTGGNDNTARLWNAETGEPLRTFEGHTNWVSSAAFSPDGRFVLTGSADQTARLWDRATGKQLRSFEGHAGPVECVAFSPDGRSVLTGSWDKTARLWDRETGQQLRSLEGHGYWVVSAAFSPDGRFVLTGSNDTTARLWDAATGKELTTLISFENGGWAVVDPDGRFDTSDLDGGAPLHWIVDGEPMHPLPLEIFMRDYYTPRLLAKILGGEKLPPLPNIAQVNRVQPRVGTPVIESSPTDPDRVRVRVTVAQQTEGGRSSGVQDLRIFRDGQLVKFQEGPLKDGEYVFDGIRLPSAESVEFTAYAFNSDRVKSETVHAAFKRPGVRAAPQPKTFVVNIGVNRNRAAGCNLQYAVADATKLGEALQNGLPAVQRQLLVSADDAHLDGASKDSIRTALAAIARQATPDDLFVLSYSGHGYTDERGLFYLFPSDLKGSCADVDADLKASAISSDELTDWVRPIDAGEMVMILDACHSAASVESGEFKPGPMGSHGLGQLAYDKRIRILAASQSTQAATETPWLGMGLLSFALTKDGLDAGVADWQPKDGTIWLREWLAYGVDRVPRLYEALRQGNAEEFRHAARGLDVPGRAKDYQNRSLQTPALFDFRRQDQQGPRLK